jgi:hypothetical protein
VAYNGARMVNILVWMPNMKFKSCMDFIHHVRSPKERRKKVRPQFFKSAIMILLVSVTKRHFTGNQHDAE